MSASLVGSEMCIRDSRPFRSPGKSSATIPRDPATCHALAARLFPRRPRLCLLYTSDAADDM
eukprot:11783704-Alexandrium_andersonii.AAC.1